MRAVKVMGAIAFITLLAFVLGYACLAENEGTEPGPSLKTVPEETTVEETTVEETTVKEPAAPEPVPEPVPEPEPLPEPLEPAPSNQYCEELLPKTGGPLPGR